MVQSSRNRGDKPSTAMTLSQNRCQWDTGYIWYDPQTCRYLQYIAPVEDLRLDRHDHWNKMCNLLMPLLRHSFRSHMVCMMSLHLRHCMYRAYIEQGQMMDPSNCVQVGTKGMRTIHQDCMFQRDTQLDHWTEQDIDYLPRTIDTMKTPEQPCMFQGHIPYTM